MRALSRCNSLAFWFLTLLAVLTPLWLAGCENKSQLEQAGFNVEKLALKSIDGDAFHISDRVKKPIVMNIWATWCTPCIKELPGLLELDKNADFSVLAVAIDGKPAVIKNFLMEHDLEELPVIWDKHGKSVRGKLGLKGVPTTYIVNKNKIVVGVEQGEREWNHPDMIKKIKAYLNQES